MKNLFRYTEEHRPDHDLRRLMEHFEVKVDHRMEEAMEWFFRKRIVLVRAEQEKRKGKLLWRLTIPLWLVYCALLIVLISPITWLFIGFYQLQRGTLVHRFTKAWINRLFP